MKFDFDKLGIHIDTTGQPYWSYIIVSIWLDFMALLYVYLRYK